MNDLLQPHQYPQHVAKNFRIFRQFIRFKEPENCNTPTSAVIRFQHPVDGIDPVVEIWLARGTLIFNCAGTGFLWERARARSLYRLPTYVDFFYLCGGWCMLCCCCGWLLQESAKSVERTRTFSLVQRRRRRWSQVVRSVLVAVLSDRKIEGVASYICCDAVWLAVIGICVVWLISRCFFLRLWNIKGVSGRGSGGAFRWCRIIR